VGNIMIDSLVAALEQARTLNAHERFDIAAGGYGLVTLHRPANVDDSGSLQRMISALRSLNFPLVFPVHPRTRRMLEGSAWSSAAEGSDSRLKLTDPIGYREFLSLILHARFVITDSGGIQEETTYLGVPCLTLRPNTERPITVLEGTNELVTLDGLRDAVGLILAGKWKKGRVPALWDGHTAQRIVSLLRDLYH
jgi:UDP-N-acetylglucosamine 2-epimerase (non-hydrolysing)